MAPVLVTGAAGEIGGAICRRLAAEGYEVIGSDLLPQPAASACMAWRTADLAHASGCDALAQGLPALHGFVHAAGVVPTARLEDVSAAGWDRTLAINARAALCLARLLAPRIGDSIVLIGSIAARRPSPDHLVYAASKAALHSLGASLAAALAPRGIRVNTVCPGIIDTARTRATTVEMAALGDDSAAAVENRRRAAIPLQRFGTADEVAEMVAFLLSARARYTTGALLSVTGGIPTGAP